MEWDDENPEALVREEVTGTEAPTASSAPVKTITVSRTQWRLAKGFSALILVVAIGGAGYILGHDVVTPAPIRTSAPGFTFPTIPSGSGGNSNFPSFQNPTATPQNTPADKAAAKIAAKVDPGLVDITSTFDDQSGTAEGTGMILTPNGLVLTNNHIVEDAATLSVRDVATNTTYVGNVVGYDLTDDVALIQLTNASGLTTITTANSDKVTSGEKIVGIGNAGGVGGTPSYVPGSVVALDQAITAGRRDESGRLRAPERTH